MIVGAVTTLWVRAGGVDVAYDRVGDGPPLVFVHGAAGDAREWRLQITGLSGDFTVIAWDEPGAGRSSELPAVFGLAGYAAALAALMETLGAPAHVCGLSWGGTVTLELYRLRPELVATLVLADTYAGWKGSLPGDEVRARVVGVKRTLSGPAGGFRSTFPGLFARKPSQDVVALLDAVAADVRPNSVRIALEAIAAADLRHVLPQIEVPTLLVWGELDARSPLSVAREFARLIPHAQLGRVPHWSRTGSADDDDVHDRHDLTDEQWDLLEPHLPRSVPGKAGRPWSDHRSVVNAVLWRTRAGAAWRDVPTGYGPWKTAYNRHRRWSGDGTWERLLSELQRGSDTGTASWDVGIDSTVIRAHQHAAGAPHTPPSDVPAERLAVAVEDFDSTRARPRPRHTGGWLPVHPLPGISDLPEDGTFGPWTMAALMSFQENNRLEVTGRLDRSTRDVLLRRSKESTLPSVKAGPHEPRDDELLRAKLCGDLFD